MLLDHFVILFVSNFISGNEDSMLGSPALERLWAGMRPPVMTVEIQPSFYVTYIPVWNDLPAEPTWVKRVLPEESQESSYNPCSTKHFSNWLHTSPSCEVSKLALQPKYCHLRPLMLEANL